jgi:hypothetical protein
LHLRPQINDKLVAKNVYRSSKLTHRRAVKTTIDILAENMKKLVEKIVFAGLFLIAIASFDHPASAQPASGGAAIQAIEEKALGGSGSAGVSKGQGRSYSSEATPAGPRQRSKVNSTNASKTSAPVRRRTASTVDPKKYDGFIVGDKYSFLNFEIVSKVQPIWTLKAKTAGASGLVQVEILIDENGNVLSAHARTGNVLLHPEAEKAALATKFNKPTLYNKPVRAMGFVVYRFGKADEEDEEND